MFDDPRWGDDPRDRDEDPRDRNERHRDRDDDTDPSRVLWKFVDGVTRC